MVQPAVRHNSALAQTELEFDSGVKGDLLSFGAVKSEMISFL